MPSNLDMPLATILRLEVPDVAWRASGFVWHGWPRASPLACAMKALPSNRSGPGEVSMEHKHGPSRSPECKLTSRGCCDIIACVIENIDGLLDLCTLEYGTIKYTGYYHSQLSAKPL